MNEKQNGVPRAGRTGAAEPEGEAPPRPQKGSSGQIRPATSPMDLARQEKSLEALGRMLKTKREINGLTRRDVALKIRIPKDQLESIEDGRLSTLPPVFAKGFLRAYANELGLDAEAILDDYRKMTGGFKNEPASREALAPRYVETWVDSGWSPAWSILATLTVLLLVLGAAFWVRPDLWQEVTALWPYWTPASETALARPGPEAEPEEAKGPAGPLASGAGPVAVASGSLSSPTPEEGVKAAEAEVPVQVPGGELTLVSQKDGVWLQLIVDGQAAKHYWLKRGQTIVQRAETGVVVRTGQGTALNAAWNGRDLGVLSGQPVVEASFPPG